MVNLFGLHIFRLPKLLSFGKFFMGGFLQISIFKIKVCIFVLCVRFVKSTRNLFNIYFLNVKMLCVFGVGFNTFFLLIISLIRMIFFLLLSEFGFNWTIFYSNNILCVLSSELRLRKLLSFSLVGRSLFFFSASPSNSLPLNCFLFFLFTSLYSFANTRSGWYR